MVVAQYTQHPHEALLDPLAWQAVGRTRGWDAFEHCQNPEHINPKAQCPECYETDDGYKEIAEGFFWNIMRGISIEEALEVETVSVTKEPFL